MGAPIQRLRHHIWHWPFLSFLREREPVLGPPETRDNGGLDKVAVTFMFEMFHRVKKGDRQRARTGLGLSICRGFVEVLGGTIEAANRIGSPGAGFTITFPESVFTAMLWEDAAE